MHIHRTVAAALVILWPVMALAEVERVMERPRAAKARTVSDYKAIVTARASVGTKCFPQKLNKTLVKIGKRFGKKPVVVSSGYRSPARNRRAGGARGSYHIRCMAADIRIDGVSKHTLARYARTLPEVGGVGLYTCNRIVHIDIGPKRSWNHRCGRRRT